MIRIEIEPVWRFKREGDSTSHLVMLEPAERDPRDRERSAARRITSGLVVSACLESDREVVGILRSAAGGTQAGKRNEPDAVRRQTRLGRTAARGPAWTSTPEPLAGTGNGNQPASPAQPVDYPGARESRIRRFEAERTAQPRRGSRGGSAVCQQPEFSRLARARWVRSRGHAPAARGVAKEKYRRLQGLADTQRSSGDWSCDPRDGADGQAGKSVRHRFACAVA